MLDRLKAEPEVRDRLFEAIRDDVLIREAVWDCEHVGPHLGPVALSDLSEMVEKVELDHPPDAEKVRQIQLRAEQELQAFLVEQDRIRRQHAAGSRSDRYPAVDLQAVAARIGTIIITLKKTAQAIAVTAALILVGPLYRFTTFWPIVWSRPWVRRCRLSGTTRPIATTFVPGR